MGHSSCVTIVEIVSLSSENLGSVDYTAPVYLFVTSIVALDTHSSLLIEGCSSLLIKGCSYHSSLLIEELLNTATSGEEYIRNNVYN